VIDGVADGLGLISVDIQMKTEHAMPAMRIQ
jgi:hypothetical protein